MCYNETNHVDSLIHYSRSEAILSAPACQRHRRPNYGPVSGTEKAEGWVFGKGSPKKSSKGLDKQTGVARSSLIQA